ncbi:uncharacterized protein TNCV_1648481 [Trichonephila clavipes]|uniref:DNA-directed DNA polymerase n=1 Tax=Trichonephila clavipes TaxID=2585209 RepID=A0A8X6V706_TRICX|nr:uncharacterized protein TNCV_1648481 [Trichonephila clavipes]
MGARQRGAKRKFSLNSNDLPYFRKRARGDETVMPNTRGYNFPPRRGAKVEPREIREASSEKRTSSIQRKQGEATVQTLRRGAKKVKQQEHQKHRWSTTALLEEERRSEQQQIPLPGSPCRRCQLQDIKIRGTDAPKNFTEKLEKDATEMDNIYKKPTPLLPLTESEKQLYDNAKNSYVCEQAFRENNIKVRDHNHVTQKCNGSCFNNCNLAMKTPEFLPVFFHNLSGYDVHIFIKELGHDKNELI